MGKALKTIWHGMVAVYEDLFRLIALNLIWAILGLPFLFLILIFASRTNDNLLTYALGGLLFTLIPNPLSLGIYYYTNQIAHDERVDLSTYWEGFRAYWRRGLVLFFINLVLVLVFIFNIVFYLTIPDNPWLRLVVILWVYVLFAWIGIQLYLGPLVIEQRQKRLFLLFRNAFLLMLDNLLFTLLLFIVELIFIIIALVIPPIATLLLKSLLAMIESFALVAILEKYQESGKQSIVSANDTEPESK